MLTERIEINPQVMLGKPVIRGTRIPLELILRKLSEGAPTEDLLPTMLHLRRAGFTPLAIFVQPTRLATELDAAAVRAAGFPAFEVFDEGMLNQLQLASRA